MTEGFGVDLAALGSAEKGVRDAVDELGGMAGWGNARAADQGMGLTNAGMSVAGQLGHGALEGACVAFAYQWDYGTRRLVEDGLGAADALGEARSEYDAADNAAQQALHRIVTGDLAAPSAGSGIDAAEES